jgi:hypothetical protein
MGKAQVGFIWPVTFVFLMSLRVRILLAQMACLLEWKALYIIPTTPFCI